MTAVAQLPERLGLDVELFDKEMADNARAERVRECVELCADIFAEEE